jgi:hypothetical protein
MITTDDKGQMHFGNDDDGWEGQMNLEKMIMNKGEVTFGNEDNGW